MGWKELCAWVAAMNRDNEEAAPAPDKWTEASRANFDELDRKRQAMRGR
jgi:hypothetical protein